MKSEETTEKILPEFHERFAAKDPEKDPTRMAYTRDVGSIGRLFEVGQCVWHLQFITPKGDKIRVNANRASYMAFYTAFAIKACLSTLTICPMNQII